MAANDRDVLICPMFFKKRRSTNHVRVIRQRQMFHLKHSQHGTRKEQYKKIKYWNIVNKKYPEVVQITPIVGVIVLFQFP